MDLKNAPVAVAEMLIRKPVGDVFKAFVDPAITSKFWFTHGTDRLAKGARVKWEWRMYGMSAPVFVKELVQDKKIVVTWGDPGTTIEWTFKPMGADKTFVSIRNSGFAGDADQNVAEAIGSTEGFTLVLAGAKAWLEQGIQLGLIGDRHPNGLPASK